MLKQIDQVKKDKGFKARDLIVYAVIAVIIVAIFCAVFFTSDTSSLKGVGIYVQNELVFVIDFEDSNTYEIYSDAVIVEEETSESMTLHISAGGGYNVVKIDLNTPSVAVTEADCRRKDCTYTAPITDNSGIIYCTPHAMKIIPTDIKVTDNGVIIM